MTREEIKINRRAVFLTHDQVVLPRKLTAENGAKKLLIGEFFEETEIPCPACNGEFVSDCLQCDGLGTVTNTIPVSRATIKAIYGKIVETLEVKP